MKNSISLILLLLTTACSTSHKTIILTPMVIESTTTLKSSVQDKVEIKKSQPQVYRSKKNEIRRDKISQTNQISKIDRTIYSSVPKHILEDENFIRARIHYTEAAKKRGRGEDALFPFPINKQFTYSNHKKFQYFICQNLPYQENNQCINKFNKARKLAVKSNLQRHFFRENYSMFTREYANIPMLYWDSNNFKKAKKYLDNINLFLDINKLHKYKYPDNIVYSYKTLKAVQGTFESEKWFFTHRYIRFIENTLRVRPKSLCKGNECLDEAWKVTQKTISSNFVDNIMESHINSFDSTDKLEQLFIKKDLLKAQRAILILADKENIFSHTKKWQNILKEKIINIENIISKNPYILKFINKSLSIDESKKNLNHNEMIISYIYSMRCREPLIWQISKNRTVFRKAEKEGCSSGKLREKIIGLEKSLKDNISIQDIKNNKDLIFLRKVLLDSLKLPKKGSTLYFIVDETMSGIPFELLPMKSGKLLGEVYKISYLPSVSVLNTLKRKNINSYDNRYIGFSKDKHPNYRHAGNLQVNRTLQNVEKYYKGSVAIKESTETAIYEHLGKKKNVKYVQFLTHNINKSRNKSVLLYGNDGQNDGELTDSEFIQNTQTSADTLLLTNCDSIGGKHDYLGEAFSPLSQSIFSALKAKRMIATRWAVQDKEVNDFTMTYLKYREKDGFSSLEAFHKAIERLKKLYSDKPIVWASFMHIGI